MYIIYKNNVYNIYIIIIVSIEIGRILVRRSNFINIILIIIYIPIPQ